MTRDNDPSGSVTVNPGATSRPAGNPTAGLYGAILGILLLALAAIAVHDLIVSAGWISGARWLRSAADWGADATWQPWMWAVAVVLVLVGLWLIASSIRPRRKIRIPLSGNADIWTRPVDLARRCSAAVRAEPGVAGATTVVGRRRVKTTVIANRDVDEADVRERVADVVSQVDPSKKVVVRFRLRTPPRTRTEEVRQ